MILPIASLQTENDDTTCKEVYFTSICYLIEQRDILFYK